MSTSEWHIISGAEDLIRMQPKLVALASRCEQAGALDALEYFLSEPNAGGLRSRVRISASSTSMQALLCWSRLPHLLFRVGAAGLDAAVLLLEYCVLGYRTGLFIPFDLDGHRTVIAPAGQRSMVAGQVASFLFSRGARLLLVSHMEASAPGSVDWKRLERGLREMPSLVATQLRTASPQLPLQSSFDRTLAQMGAHTRRNLRLAQRRVQKEMDARYISHADLALEEFLALSRRSMYPVPQEIAIWRFHTARSMQGGMFAGLCAGDGRWLSLLGGHTTGDMFSLDWQMNLTGYASLSLGTAMRAFLIEDQIERGLQWIRFEGGTPHTISSAFAVEHACDLLFAYRLLPARLLRWVFQRAPASGLLANALTSDTFTWRRIAHRRSAAQQIQPNGKIIE
ncbi:MAG: hypothetical protein ACRYFU_23520 [Janthinobacterium lividum]